MFQLPPPRSDIVEKKIAIAAALRNKVGESAVVDDKVALRAYESDALCMITSTPMLVVLPASTEEASEVVRICHKFGAPIVPRGAGTSLSGGAVATEDAVVIGLSRMNKILSIDLECGTVTVQAGVTNSGISAAVDADGFFYAPDPSSQLACTIGGNIAMNSGGAHCLKYGVTFNNVLGVRMVLPDGTLMDMGGDYFDTAGYDLLGLICGSEGQFGLVTEATVRILPKQPGARAVLIGFNTSVAAGQCVADIVRSGLAPVAIEFMDKPAIHVCDDYSGAGYPRDVEAMLIIEVEGSEAEIDAQMQKVVAVANRYSPATVRSSSSEAESAAIWAGRKAAFGAMGKISDYFCMDGVIPLGKLPQALAAIADLANQYDLRVANIFHAGDGNLHPLVLFDANDAESQNKALQLGDEILKLCVNLGGCLSGEHGVGIEKRDLMSFQYSPQELNQQYAVKSVFDQHGTMNHAKVFPLTLPDNQQSLNS